MSDFWAFTDRPAFGPLVTQLRKDRISVNWFIPPVSQHGGGHINLFRFASGLEARGFSCRIVVTNDGTTSPRLTDNVLQRQVEDWFGHFSGGVGYMGEQTPPAHVSVATGWQSAYGVRAFNGSPLKYYFIQDFEPWFFPMGSEYVFAEATYRFGFTGVTAGSWLAKHVASAYGMTAHAVGFSYDRNLYKPLPRLPGPPRLFFYARPETPRRGWELAQLVIKRVHQARPDVEFILAGGYVPPNSFSFQVHTPGALSVSDLPNLYSQCDCALVLSFSNLSLLPLELMACGVPIVSNRGPNVEWLLNEQIAELCPPDASSLASGVLRVITAPERDQRERRNRALAFASATDWEREVDTMARVLSTDAGRLMSQPRAKSIATR